MKNIGTDYDTMYKNYFVENVNEVVKELLEKGLDDSNECKTSLRKILWTLQFFDPDNSNRKLLLNHYINTWNPSPYKRNK